MQATMPQKNIVLHQALIFGIGLGIFNLIVDAITAFVNLGSGGAILTIISIIVAILAYGCAGLRAAQATGRVGTGALAGLFTGLFAGLISAIGTFAFTFMNVDTLRQRSQDVANQLHLSIQYTNAEIIAATFGTVVLALGIAIGLGAGIGAIGGVIGKNRTATPTYS